MEIYSAIFRDALAKIPKDLRKQMDWSFDISDRIDTELKKRGMTQKDFAHLMGRSEAEVSRWLMGRHNFTLATLAKISTVLGVDLIRT